MEHMSCVAVESTIQWAESDKQGWYYYSAMFISGEKKNHKNSIHTVVYNI